MPPLFHPASGWQGAAVALVVALGCAYAVAELAARLAQVVLTAIHDDARAAAMSPTVTGPVRTIRAAVFLLVAATLAFPALELAGAGLHVGVQWEALKGWFFESGLRIVLIAVLAYSLIRVVASVVSRLEHDISRGETRDLLERAKRARTLGNLIRSVVASLVLGIATLMILRELRLDIVPLLTGAGILGLAVGFGAQTLVRDVIAGFFLILENQVRVGDAAVINGTGGLVEAITLRTIVLRDIEGVVHVFPNGAINTLANRTKDFSYAVIDVGVAYAEDTDRVIDVLRTVGVELQRDAAHGPSILEPIEILGVDAFKDSQVVIKVRIKTLPLRQWEVGRELRRRIKKAFDAQHIAFHEPVREVRVLGSKEVERLNGSKVEGD